MKRWLSIVCVLAAVMLAVALGYFAGYRSAASRSITEEMAAREQAFARAMTGVVLEGSFTAGSGPEVLRGERYVIDGVQKIAGDYWLFRARLDFGGREIALPVPVRLAWAEDTPMVTLTDLSLPGLGTFTARVVFYRDRYAGLWWGAESSGHQFGRIVREPRNDGTARPSPSRSKTAVLDNFDGKAFLNNGLRMPTFPGTARLRQGSSGGSTAFVE